MCNFSRVKHFIKLIFFNESLLLTVMLEHLFSSCCKLMCSNTAFCESGLGVLNSNKSHVNSTTIYTIKSCIFFSFFLTYFRRKMGALSVTSLFLGERSFLVAILDIDEITVGKGAMVSVWFSSFTLTSPALIVVTIVNGLVIIFCEFFAVSALFSCILNSVPFFG